MSRLKIYHTKILMKHIIVIFKAPYLIEPQLSFQNKITKNASWRDRGNWTDKMLQIYDQIIIASIERNGFWQGKWRSWISIYHEFCSNLEIVFRGNITSSIISLVKNENSFGHKKNTFSAEWDKKNEITVEREICVDR